MKKKGIISNPWCYLRVSLTHQKRQNIGDSSGNCLLLDWFITEDTMGKKARQLFSFSLKQTYTKVQSTKWSGKLFTWNLKKTLRKTSGNRLFLDWFITEDTMKKKGQTAFQFSIEQNILLQYTKVLFKYQVKYVTLHFFINLFSHWLAFCTALEIFQERNGRLFTWHLEKT